MIAKMIFANALDGSRIGREGRGCHDARLVLGGNVENGKIGGVEIVPDRIQVSQGEVAVGYTPAPVEMEKVVGVVSVADESVSDVARTA